MFVVIYTPGPAWQTGKRVANSCQISVVMLCYLQLSVGRYLA
jgi:hypothetical protein